MPLIQITLDPEAKKILSQAWSVKFMVMAGICAAGEAALPFLDGLLPQRWLALAALVFSIVGLIARVIQQPNMRPEAEWPQAPGSDGTVELSAGLTPRTRAQRIALAIVAAASIAIPAEGLRQTAYRDPPGILTVCYGHTGNVDANKRYSKAECMVLLSEDMQQAVVAVDACQPDLPLGVLIAFSDAVFNMGPTIACDRQRSTAARLLAAGDYEAACNQLPRWDKARVAGVMVALPGLTKRREREREVCLKGAANDPEFVQAAPDDQGDNDDFGFARRVA